SRGFSRGIEGVGAARRARTQPADPCRGGKLLAGPACYNGGGDRRARGHHSTAGLGSRLREGGSYAWGEPVRPLCRRQCSSDQESHGLTSCGVSRCGRGTATREEAAHGREALQQPRGRETTERSRAGRSCDWHASCRRLSWLMEVRRRG